MNQRGQKRKINTIRHNYASAIVLGLNDALVEISGTLAGLTLAFQNPLLIGVTGLIMGIAASLSMTASEYFSAREEGRKDCVTSAMYTGGAYILTLIVLVSPYFFFSNVFTALTAMMISVLAIIGLYTKYISVAKKQSFWGRFFQMALISVGVALISFLVGYGLKVFFGIDV